MPNKKKNDPVELERLTSKLLDDGLAGIAGASPEAQQIDRAEQVLKEVGRLLETYYRWYWQSPGLTIKHLYNRMERVKKALREYKEWTLNSVGKQ